MKKLTAILMACLLLLLTACGGQQETAQEAENTPESVLSAGIGTEADESGTAANGAALTEESGTTDHVYESVGQYTDEETAAQFLSAVAGTYQELFPVLCREEYRQIWLDNCAAIVDGDIAEETADMLIASVTGTLTGEEAVKAYQDGGAFCCTFLQGVDRFTFDGSTFSGTDADGNELFRHEYRFTGVDENTGMYVFESIDADSGEFTFFCLAPDTPAGTYHIEFRYGSDLDALGSFDAGSYAYWMAAGIPVDFDQTMVENCIALFCTENLAG